MLLNERRTQDLTRYQKILSCHRTWNTKDTLKTKKLEMELHVDKEDNFR